MRLQLAFFGLFVSLLSSCGGSKEVTEKLPPPDPRPQWVKSRPFNPGAYIGIGSAPKLSSGSDHQIQAKNQALSDLASEISINISGSSLLYQMEDNDDYRESFQSNVKTRTAEQLSGYEVSGIYEDERQYWVMYELDKQVYAEDKEKRKSKAIELSLFHRSEAEKFLNEGEDILAIESYLKALEDLHDFWNEDLQTEIGGQKVFLGNQIFADLSSAVRGISVIPNSKFLDWKIGTSIPRDLLGFQFLSHNASPLKNAPVFVHLSNYRLRPNQIKTNSRGRLSIDELPSGIQPGREQLTATLNLVALIERSTSDPLIGLMANSIPPSQASTEIQFSYPSIQILSNEKEFGENTSGQLLATEMESMLLKDGFQLKSTDADLVLEINADTRKGNAMDKFYSSLLSARIRLTNGDGKLLHEIRLNDIKGVQLSYEKASDESYSKAAGEIRKRYYRDLGINSSFI
jgi:hypothetical protein